MVAGEESADRGHEKLRSGVSGCRNSARMRRCGPPRTFAGLHGGGSVRTPPRPEGLGAEPSARTQTVPCATMRDEGLLRPGRRIGGIPGDRHRKRGLRRCLWWCRARKLRSARPPVPGRSGGHSRVLEKPERGVFAMTPMAQLSVNAPMPYPFGPACAGRSSRISRGVLPFAAQKVRPWPRRQRSHGLVAEST